MGFLGDVFGSIGGNAAERAPQTAYQGQYKGLETSERDRYAQKISDLESGQGPSVANQYVANAQQASLAQALAQANSARGGINPAMAYRNALNAAAQGSQQAVQQGAMMRAQEGIAGQQLAQNYAQMGLQGDLANQGAYNQMQGINAGIATSNLGAQTSFGTQGMKQGGDMMQGIISGAGAAASGGATAGAYAGGKVTLGDALMQRGGTVPGQANVAGDSPKNDTVHAMLSPGEIVIPRTLAEDPERAKKFIEQLQKEKKPKASYGNVLAAKRKK